MKNVPAILFVSFIALMIACNPTPESEAPQVEPISSEPTVSEVVESEETVVTEEPTNESESEVSEKEDIPEKENKEQPDDTEKKTRSDKNETVATPTQPTKTGGSTTVKPKPPVKTETTQPVKTTTTTVKPTPPPAAPLPSKPPKPEPVVVQPSTPAPAIEETPVLPDMTEGSLPSAGVGDVPPPPTHSGWDELLQKYVSASGDVNYTGFKSKKNELEAYIRHLANFPPKRSWSANKEMAYWINLYNAWTVKVILDNYPTGSIMNIDGGSTWKVKRVVSGDNTYSLDEVENKILRPKFKDARIHFAVNCAARSCPPLLNRAWTEDNVQRYYDKQAKSFIQNNSFNEISQKKVKISKIFEWYAEDFGNIISYLNKYATTKIDADAKVEYMEYDWDLNGK